MNHHAIVAMDKDVNDIELSYTQFSDNENLLMQMTTRGRWVVERVETLDDKNVVLVFPVPANMSRYGCERFKEYTKKAKAKVMEKNLSELKACQLVDLSIWRMIMSSMYKKWLM